MENESISEDVSEIQLYVVKLRKNYPKTILKYYEQNSDIDLKLLEKQKLKSGTTYELPKDFVLDNNLLDTFNEELIDKDRMNLIKNNLKNLNKIILQNIKMRNCDLYNLINERTKEC